ncbi:flagellar export protein FliJ [Dasania sp. GY-MA-18]|uniref:Flagellar FliJ protein n=1 Tax=Dasania phycosphaerae TaxID=2950436 RepID=A0A9J6RHE5_9GAMM|nr:MULTISPECIES: flagellar export protein FliJ [Dasania]MCR8921658.1 flagellar export protein FliJ [Dasania sp. GY-MA-18]MCZ0864086.1 flagellar export protein FliJ [Dasania phycosphaerae]MCZ0867814.1 flagellar export protein FliJ [Dasania phycosphaerae]
MAKKSSQRLQVVLKLAHIKQQQAAEKLAQAAAAVQRNQAQGEQLRVYQGEYNKHFHNYENQPVSSQQMRNYQRFYSDLEEAVYTQDQRSSVAETQFEFHRQQWQKRYASEKNMEKLVVRKQQQEDQEQELKIQRELDDRASGKRSELAD